MIRIYPALTVETVLSALILGPLVTSFPIDAYFGDPRFASYLLNILGDIHYVLPGVFLANPEPNIVNGQLWTVPYELACYIAIAALTVLGVKRRRALAPLAAAMVLAVFVIGRAIKYGGDFPQFATALPGPLLLASFLIGVSLYLYRDLVAFDGRLCLLSALAALALLGLIPNGEYVAPLPAAYLTIYIGLLDPTKIRLLRGADYSYGIFLYSFSIQQAVCATFPWARHWYLNILICLPLSTAVAALSWYCVEKPALRLRRGLMALEARLCGDPAVSAGKSRVSSI